MLGLAAVGGSAVAILSARKANNFKPISGLALKATKIPSASTKLAANFRRNS